MRCHGCNRDLTNKERYFTLVCNTNDNAIFTFPYCNPMCISLDWKCVVIE